MTPNERLRARLAAARGAKTAVTLAPPPATAPATKPAATATPAPAPAPARMQLSPPPVTIAAPTPALAGANRAAKVQMDNIGPNGEYGAFKEVLHRLATDLDNEIPEFATSLREAFMDMSKDPNVVTVMSEEEIGIIVAGLGKHRDVTVVVQKKGSTKKSQPLDLDDL